MSQILQLLDAADNEGLDTVLDQRCADEQHLYKIVKWLQQPNPGKWQNFLNAHPELLTDPRTEEFLVQYGNSQHVRQHLAIVRLAAGMPLDRVYDVVADANDAMEAALAAIDATDLDRLTEVWHAAPHLERHPFLGPYLAAILSIYTAGPDGHDHARQLITTAARLRQQLDQANPPDPDGQLDRLRQQVNAASTRLHHLADNHPAHAEILYELAKLLTTADTTSTNTRGTAEPTQDAS